MEKNSNQLLTGAILALSIFMISCATVKPDTQQAKEPVTADSEISREFIKLIEKINSSSPDTISSSFTADGETSGKKFKVEGRVVYEKKGNYYVTIKDFVFRSPVIDIYREGDKLYFHYPNEKKLLTDDVNKINLNNYSGLKTDYRFLETLLTGGIPLIRDYKVSRLLKEGEGAHYLILENSEFFENIFFKGDMPEKILLMHKESRSKAEIYLKSVMKTGDASFFRNVKIAAPGLGVNLDLYFSKPVLNGEVKVNNAESLRKKKGIEIIRVN